MRKNKKKLIIILLIGILFITLFIVFNKKEEKGKVSSDKKDIVDVIEHEKDGKEETVIVDNQELNGTDATIEQEEVKDSNNNSGGNGSYNSSNSASSNNSSSNKSTNISPNKTESSSKSNTQSNNSSTNNNSQASTNNYDGKSIDTTHPDYYIHKGKKDCTDSSSCMDISLPIQLKYKKNISNTFYVEVKSKDGTVLGYFIEYVFKEYTYSSDEECNQVGNEIKSTLSDRVTGFSCNSGNLKIITNY